MDAKLFKALSDSNRLHILEILGEGESSARLILENLDITQPTLSHHMKVLQSARLVDVRKSGQSSFYSLNDKTLDEIMKYIRDLKSSC